uniref:hypothetical protein n=1 Tax=Burkholderia gladioli TaxID=28095 RepID=UPI00244588A6
MKEDIPVVATGSDSPRGIFEERKYLSQKDENDMAPHDHERRVAARAGVPRRPALKVIAAELTRLALS